MLSRGGPLGEGLREFLSENIEQFIFFSYQGEMYSFSMR